MAKGCPLQTMAKQGGSCTDCAQYHAKEPCVLRKTQKQADAIEKKLRTDADAIEKKLHTIEQLLYTIQRDVRSLK